MRPSSKYYAENFYEAGIAKIPAEQFMVWANRALAELDSITFSRVMQESEDDIRIQQCICEIAEALYIEGTVGNVKSENNDGYSVTYADDETTKDKIKRICERYLANTGLLYRGF